VAIDQTVAHGYNPDPMARPEIKVRAPELRLPPESAVQPLDWRGVFSREGPVEVEVGIGKGRFLLAAAAARPDVLHLGVEWANKYLRVAEDRALKRGMSNVRFLRADARDLVHRAIASASVSAYYVFYPDPWPKKRHHKRRFFRPDTVDHLARTLVEGGALHVSTDHTEYWEAIVAVLDAHPAFERQATFGGADFPLVLDGPLTNYEEKYLTEGRERHRASFRRRAAPAWHAPERQIDDGRP
jgi:tRNA (guanine-N7-)-methyltransferase